MGIKSRRKKGVALIYNPHNLHQFIWYYCTYGRDYDWTALCFPNGYKGEYMSEYCKKSGIFKEIIRRSESFVTIPVRKKCIMFIQMFLYALTKQQMNYCRKYIENYLSYDEYDIAVVLTDAGIVSGMFIGAGNDKKIVILEDGTGDYAERGMRYLQKHWKNFYDWQGFLIAKMGYANPGYHYRLNTTKHCEKFSSHPDQMIYRDYKNIRQLFDFTYTDEALFQKIVKKVYHQISEYDFEQIDAVVFTNRLSDFCEDAGPYIEKFQNYINGRYKNILLKRHPRDETNYMFDEQIRVQEIDNSIPAEVILPYIKGKEVVFMFASSIFLYMQAYSCRPHFLYFDGLYEQNIKSNTLLKYITKKEMMQQLKRFGLCDSHIIEIIKHGRVT